MKKIREYDEGWVENQSPMALWVKIVAAVVVALIVACAGSFVFRWLNTGANVISPENVTQQWQFAYEYDRSLTAIAQNWCTAKTVEDQATGDAKDQRVSQRVAQENLYRAKEAQYDAALANAFKAKLVRPPDVPAQAPTLEQKVLSLGLQCGSN